MYLCEKRKTSKQSDRGRERPMMGGFVWSSGLSRSVISPNLSAYMFIFLLAIVQATFGPGSIPGRMGDPDIILCYGYHRFARLHLLAHSYAANFATFMLTF